jgi:hypothetical protein
LPINNHSLTHKCSNKYQFYSLWFDLVWSQINDLPHLRLYRFIVIKGTDYYLSKCTSKMNLVFIHLLCIHILCTYTYCVHTLIVYICLLCTYYYLSKCTSKMNSFRKRSLERLQYFWFVHALEYIRQDTISICTQ